MRAALAFLFFLLTAVPLHAQESDLDFSLVVGTPRADFGFVVIPIELTVPLDGLHFVDGGVAQGAAFSVRSVAGGRTSVLEASYPVTVPRGFAPGGEVTRRYELRAARGQTSIDVIVRDESTQFEGRLSIVIDGTEARLDDRGEAQAAVALWNETLERAASERKPIVVFYTTRPCSRCRRFIRTTVPHPAIRRRLPAVVYATLPGPAGEDPSVAFFDRRGVLRARWPIIPDTTDFGIILDSVHAVAADFERAAQLAETTQPDAAELAVAGALARMGRTGEAREPLARARVSPDVETRQRAIVMTAILDANSGKPAEALAALEPIAASPASKKIGADAWMAIGAIRRAAGETEEAAKAFTAVAQLVDKTSAQFTEAKQSLEDLRNARRIPDAIRVLPLGHQVVHGRQHVRTHVGSPAVASVAFSLDGRQIARVARPPFSATLDFGEVPERHAVRAVAFNRRGQEIGRTERIVNDAGENFWLHLLTPREEWVSGATRVTMDVRVPPSQQLRRLVLTWNDAERAVLRTAPWEATIRIPEGELGILRAVAELHDGRTSEDAVLLNAGGVGARSDVQLVELPITIASRTGTGSVPPIAANQIVVREGKQVRRVESVATAAETPLTIGLLIDVSASMQTSLLDVQEAAIGFLESTLGTPLGTPLGTNDRAFVITFDTRARILQPPTSDVAQLRRQIMTLRPDGLTAIYDAMTLGLLQFEGVKGRRAMIVFTDGLDRTSEYRAPDVRDLARRAHVPIHLIASTPGAPARLAATAPAAPTRYADPAAKDLPEIARSTGGSSQALDNLSDLPTVYARIEAALRNQILAFVRVDPAQKGNEWRAVKVEVQGTDLEVFAPEGYYATW
jgi:Ca-activated chloride channel family protein